MENVLTQEMIVHFVEHLQSSEKAQNTIEKYRRDSIRFMQFLNGLPVTKERVIQYKKYLWDEKYSVRSINSMLASVNALLYKRIVFVCNKKIHKLTGRFAGIDVSFDGKLRI